MSMTSLHVGNGPLEPLSPAASLASPASTTVSHRRIHHHHDVVLTMPMPIRQDSFSVTLDAWAVMIGAVLLVTGMHVMASSILEALILVLPLGLLVRNDYRNFLLLGPGGTPPTFRGYLRLLWFRLFALRDVYHIPEETTTTKSDEDVSGNGPQTVRNPSHGILNDHHDNEDGHNNQNNLKNKIKNDSGLPYRPGPRPQVAGLAPQRQLDQHADPACYEALRSAVEALAQNDPERFSTATSCIEKHGFGLFARHPVNAWSQGGEVFHIHDMDKSMHMSLHPDDIREVLEKGWGQRHPLAFAQGWIKPPLPETFVMIYAPRDESDLKIIAQIVEAAIWYTLAEKVNLNLPPIDQEA